MTSSKLICDQAEEMTWCAMLLHMLLCVSPCSNTEIACHCVSAALDGWKNSDLCTGPLHSEGLNNGQMLKYMGPVFNIDAGYSPLYVMQLRLMHIILYWAIWHAMGGRNCNHFMYENSSQSAIKKQRLYQMTISSYAMGKNRRISDRRCKFYSAHNLMWSM